MKPSAIATALVYTREKVQKLTFNHRDLFSKDEMKNLLLIGGLSQPRFQVQALTQALSVWLSLSLLVSALPQYFIDFRVSGELKRFVEIFKLQ